MSIRKRILCFNFLILFSGCATTYAPHDWLPKTEDIQKEAYGGWMTLFVKPDSLKNNDKYLQYNGEFISADTLNVYLLADSLYIVNKVDVISSLLELDRKNSTDYGLWTAGGCLLTITNGFYSIITAPIWLITGIPVSVGESVRDRYETDNPNEAYWNDIQKFARFPQGIYDIDLTSLKPKAIIDNKKK